MSVLSKYANEANPKLYAKLYVLKREKILITPKPGIVKEGKLPTLGMCNESIRRRRDGNEPINDATHACSKLKECIVCHQIDPKMQKCSGCRWAFYCSAVCQLADWANHKSICDPDETLPMHIQKLTIPYNTLPGWQSSFAIPEEENAIVTSADTETDEFTEQEMTDAESDWSTEVALESEICIE